MRIILALIATVLFPVMVGAAAADGATSLTVSLSDTLDAFRSRYGVPGATAAIVLPDGTLATAATGFADVEAGWS
ncbi:hypothetical protein AB4874_10755 [Thioclava sp. 15-R06ZXC-3]|uniref:Serine hydrolase n=1 Tax=Thioclava arctica TaxID=3238301 RepID=A0ABV3TLJ2_9RHOB